MREVKIKDVMYPFLFAIKAQREMMNEDTSKKDDIYFIWLGFKYGSIKESKIFPYTEDDLVDIFEDDLKIYEKSCELLGEDMGVLKKLKGLALKALA